MAKKYKKPIIAIRPRGALNTSTVVLANADEIVSWNGKSIINAIKKHG